MLFLFIGCKPKESDRRIELNEVVDYREVLFGVEDSLKLVSINFKLSARDVSDQVEKVVNNNICGSDFVFKVEDFDVNKHKVQVHKICKIPFNYFCGPKPGFELRINWSGQYLFEREILESNKSLDSLIFNSLINEKYYDLNEQFVIVDWVNYDSLSSDLCIPEISFYNALNEIEKGYLLTYDSLSRQYFKKQLSNLDRKELDSLKKVLPFKVQIGEISVPLPPPPPPLKKE